MTTGYITYVSHAKNAFAWSFKELIKIFDTAAILPTWADNAVARGDLTVHNILANNWRVTVNDFTGQKRTMRDDEYLVLLGGEFIGQLAIYGVQDIDHSFEPYEGDTETFMLPAQPLKDAVNHPDHYGGKDNPYEVIKVIFAWGLDFCLGNAVKYIARAGKKDPEKEIEDLEKAVNYLNMKIKKVKEKKDARAASQVLSE